ncbi:MAG TPA: LysM peptidoglycan-binding domain-containing protein [Polyangiaceae bacterium]|nr:LysM peptidoglycan-binding domain-containing protein [Polyangiaceae bacterium]
MADAGSRRRVAGGPTVDDASTGVETTELRALREAERDLFPPAAPAPGNPWPSDLPLFVPGEKPLVLSSGLPPAAPLAPPAPAEGGRDLSWLARLELPDLPVRWDERVIRYIEFFRDDPRGHSTLVTLYRHSGRWREMIRRTLRRKALPEDLVWVSMLESGFDAAAHSVAGAAGLWQFMPESAKLYGLTIDRWVDQRYDSSLSTEAAADFLGDLHRRFGSWELALAAFNMGYGGLSSVVHRYNSNDFWALAHMEGTLPWETTVYVPKILALAVAAHNPSVFGLSDVVVDPQVEFDEVSASPGTPLALVAQAAGCPTKDVESLNPELRASRTPPVTLSDAAYPVKVPPGKGTAASQGLSRWHRDQGSFERYVVRFGETVEQIAAAHHTTAQKLIELNAIAPGEAIRGGTVLLVPKGAGPVADAVPPPSAAGKPNVVVPAALFVFPDRRRVFYRVLVADTLKEIASALHVTQDDLCRWNDVDPGGRLQEGMTLQAFVPNDADLTRVAVLTEADVHVLPIGSDEFFTALERDKGFKRVTVTAQAGDTIGSIGQRFGVPAKTMERINRRSRKDAPAPGEPVVVYVPNGTAAPRSSAVAVAGDPVGNGPLPVAPEPDLLP